MSQTARRGFPRPPIGNQQQQRQQEDDQATSRDISIIIIVHQFGYQSRRWWRRRWESSRFRHGQWRWLPQGAVQTNVSTRFPDGPARMSSLQMSTMQIHSAVPQKVSSGINSRRPRLPHLSVSFINNDDNIRPSSSHRCESLHNNRQCHVFVGWTLADGRLHALRVPPRRTHLRGNDLSNPPRLPRTCYLFRSGKYFTRTQVYFSCFHLNQ